MAQKYGWFSPVKGAYPGMGQEDKTAELVVSDAETVCRGMILELNAEEVRLAKFAMLAFRNKLLSQGKPTEDVVELILKIMK